MAEKNADNETPSSLERLTELRQAIGEVDRSLLELLHRRMDLAAEVGHIKAAEEKPILVPEVHDQVLRRARRHAEACGVSEEVMESIFNSVMQGSIERQHRIAEKSRRCEGNRLLVIGGAGNMGVWFQGFSRRLGHRVDIVDPAMAPLPKTPGRFGALKDVEDLDAYDAVLVSVSLGAMPQVLSDVIAARPRGLVIEIASIKDHLRDTLARAEESGVRVASLHPMFGPGKSVYEPLVFVVACRQDPQSEKLRLDDWLRYPNTRMVPIPFDHHDRLMGWLLGLAHLSGMLFGCALEHSGLGADELQACASTTYDRQLSTARSVLQEDPDLYFDIQHLNPHRHEVYESAREALDKLVAAVQSEDRQGFRHILTQASHFVSGR